jgi:ABC-type transporter Mla subunit MlaD
MYADKLASELEMSDTSGKQDSDELHSRLDKEVQALTEKYDAKLAEALQKLNQVTQELGSSKTDRKTLAKLLATVASNLETDQE